MKKKLTPQSPSGKAVPWNNPFAGLKLDLPKENLPPPPPPSPEEQKRQALSAEDQKLLTAFGGETLAVGSDTPTRKGPKISFNLQRKGKGGKTVTLVFGLKDLELEAQMALGTQLQKALGIGARFEDGVLQLQGDQRERARQWLADRGYRC